MRALPLLWIAAAAAQNSSVCTEFDAIEIRIDASLDAKVHKAVQRTIKPKLAWHVFLRDGGALPDRALAVIPVRRDRGPPASTLLYLTTHCSECHLSTLRWCWPSALRRSPLLGLADVLLYAGCTQLATDVASWAHALAALPVRNATLAWTRWNPGLQEGALSAVMIAARRGWFDRYAWIVRTNPDVRFEDTSFLAAEMRESSAVLERCCPRNTSHPAICTDFFAARPAAMNHSLWAHGPRLLGRRVHNEWAAALVFQGAMDSGRATVWEIEDTYRTSGCRVGGHGIYHDHAFCARLPAAEAPAPAAPSYPYLASYAVFLLSFASVRLLSSFSTRRNNEHEK